MSTPHKAVAEWNRHNDVGELITYRRDDGSIVRTRTSTPAAVLGNHTAVIWLQGIAGCVALERVKSVRERAA